MKKVTSKITLAEYFQIHNIGGKKGSITMTEFADRVGISVSYISKVYRGRSVSTYLKSPKWLALCDYIASEGYELVTISKEDTSTTMVYKKLELKLKTYEDLDNACKCLIEAYQEMDKVKTVK